MEKESEMSEVQEEKFKELNFSDIPLFNTVPTHFIHFNEKESQIVKNQSGFKITKVLEIKLDVQEINDWVKYLLRRNSTFVISILMKNS
jgi:hypothetical protein